MMSVDDYDAKHFAFRFPVITAPQMCGRYDYFINILMHLCNTDRCFTTCDLSTIRLDVWRGKTN